MTDRRDNRDRGDNRDRRDNRDNRDLRDNRNNRDKRDIKIMGSQPHQSQIAAYLLRAFLLLRDRENSEQYVRLLGIGTAIPVALLISEIIRKKLSRVSCIIKFVTENKTGQREDGSNYVRSSTAVEVKLTLNPSQEEIDDVGYQKPLDIPQEDIREVDLFDYVMLYVIDLYQIKTKNFNNNPKMGRQSRQYKQDQSPNQNRGRNQDNNQDRQQSRRDDRATQDNNWNESRQQDNLKSQGQNDNRVDNRGSNSRDTNNDVVRGQQKTRGQNRDNNQRYDRRDEENRKRDNRNDGNRGGENRNQDNRRNDDGRRHDNDRNQENQRRNEGNFRKEEQNISSVGQPIDRLRRTQSPDQEQKINRGEQIQSRGGKS